jgi:hypothetical protein
MSARALPVCACTGAMAADMTTAAPSAMGDIATRWKSLTIANL